MRVSLPNRPGALGAVASALGRIGADISLVEIVEKRGDVEVDEFILDLPASQSVATLVAACDCVTGVQVQSVRNYPRGGGIELDVELSRRMAADSSRADEILVSAAPLVFRASWSVLLRLSPTPRVVFSTPGAPDLEPDIVARLRPFDTMHRVASEPTWLPGWEAHHAVVAPLCGQRVVIIARRGDPPFFGSELARLAHLTGNGSTIDVPDQPASTTERSPAHRRPVAPPLYLRDGAQTPDTATD
ncbi:MAG TPA: amino acid-binding protein [Microlunatus sp.]